MTERDLPVLSPEDMALLRELREVFEAIDPVPHYVVEMGKAAFSLRNLEADLMELVQFAPELAQMRETATSRLHVFELGDVTLDVELTVSGATCSVLGELSAPYAAGDASVTVQTAARRFEVTTDEAGRFEVTGIPLGMLRILVRPTDGAALTTPWIAAE